MKRLPMIADILFYSLSAALVGLCILRYYDMAAWLALCVSALIALAVGGISFLLLSGRRQRRLLSKKEREAREALLLHLALEKPERVRAALLTAFLADGRDAHCEGDVLRVDDGTFVPLFTMEPVGADMVAHLIQSHGREFTLVCNALTPDAERLLASFGTDVLRGDDVFALFLHTETTPNPLICGEIPRRSVKEKFRRSFSKVNARPFFVSGAILLIMSLFTFFPLYYLISGSILLLLAVIIRLFGYAVV